MTRSAINSDPLQHDTKGKEVPDEFGLWEHMLQHGFGLSAYEVSNADRFSRAISLQTAYGAAQVAAGIDRGEGPCQGMNRRYRQASESEAPENKSAVQAYSFDIDKKPGKSFLKNRCRGAFCPSCWTVAQIKCLHHLEKTLPMYKHVYYRETSLLPYNMPPPAALWTRFIAVDTRYQMLAWTIAFEPAPTEYEMLKFIGIFAAKPINGVHTPIHERDVELEQDNILCAEMQRHRVIDRELGCPVGTVSRTQLFDPENGRELWLRGVGHPSSPRNEPYYIPAIAAVDKWLTRTHGCGRIVYPKGQGPKSGKLHDSVKFRPSRFV